MSKWKCEICEKGFDNFHAQGFDGKIYCPLCFFKEKTNRLEKENERLKDKINKINNLLNEPTFEYDNIPCNIENEITQLKDILKEN